MAEQRVEVAQRAMDHANKALAAATTVTPNAGFDAFQVLTARALAELSHAIWWLAASMKGDSPS